jgi:hypothetical protein
LKPTPASAFLVVFLAGAVVGPGYLLYCTHLSGSSAAEHELFSLDTSPVAVRGVTRRVVKGENDPIPPVTLSLSPDMNPIGIGVAGRYIRPLAGTSRNKYSIALSRNNDQKWERTIMVQADSGGKQDRKHSLGDIKVAKMGLDSFSFHVKSFPVTEEGKYTLLVKRVGQPSLHVADMKVTVRRNVVMANKSVVLCGSTALAIGLAGLVIIGITNEKKAI